MKKLLTIRKVGSSLRLTISEIARELGLSEGDKVQVMRTPKGFELMPYDADFGKAVETARDFMNKYLKAMKKIIEIANFRGCVHQLLNPLRSSPLALGRRG